MELKKVVKARTMLPGKSFEESRIIISYEAEQVTPTADEINIAGIKSQITKMTEVINKAVLQRNILIAELKAINDDTEIDGTIENIPIEIKLVEGESIPEAVKEL